MSKKRILTFSTNGEHFYNLSDAINCELEIILSENTVKDGTLTLFVPHTSCALTINESFDPTACEDLQRFLKHLAPRNLKFIKHTSEGEDDSPSHMKSMLLQSSIALIVENGKIVLGTWQGIYLCEFRDSPKNRNIYLKYQPDTN